MITEKELYDIFGKCNGVTTDSRAITGGELFFALKGENFDGNEYALKALDAGAAYSVVSASSAVASSGDERIVPVEDTLTALQSLAAFHRRRMAENGSLRAVVGLTGTNGKTTTKELVRTVLSVKYDVTATEGNLNNSIGVPLSVLRISPGTQIAVIEMGASHPGDIKELVNVAQPDYGLITNVGKAHLLGFGSFEGVKSTKGELYDYIASQGGKIFLNMDNGHLRSMAASRRLDNAIGYGILHENVKILPATSREPYLRLSLESGTLIGTRLVGSYNADNILAAMAVGREFGISEKEAADAISAYVPANNRSQMTVTQRNTLIVDAYNANPTSMESALANFAYVEASKKIVMLGDMLELGADSLTEHKAVVEKVMGMDIERAYLVGGEFCKALGKADGKCIWCASSDDLAQKIASDDIEGYVILIKGSRGIRMEKVVSVL